MARKIKHIILLLIATMTVVMCNNNKEINCVYQKSMSFDFVYNNGDSAMIFDVIDTVKAYIYDEDKVLIKKITLTSTDIKEGVVDIGLSYGKFKMVYWAGAVGDTYKIDNDNLKGHYNDASLSVIRELPTQDVDITDKKLFHGIDSIDLIYSFDSDGNTILIPNPITKQNVGFNNLFKQMTKQIDIKVKHIGKGFIDILLSAENVDFNFDTSFNEDLRSRVYYKPVVEDGTIDEDGLRSYDYRVMRFLKNTDEFPNRNRSRLSVIYKNNIEDEGNVIYEGSIVDLISQHPSIDIEKDDEIDLVVETDGDEVLSITIEDWVINFVVEDL